MYPPMINRAFGHVKRWCQMRAASGHIRSCTTAAELKSNVARCLYSPRGRPLVPFGFTRYRLLFDCLAVTFYFQQRGAVAGRSPANLITISLSLSSSAIVFATFLPIFSSYFLYLFKNVDLRSAFYFRNEHVGHLTLSHEYQIGKLPICTFYLGR